jgi:hypothetical protein
MGEAAIRPGIFDRALALLERAGTWRLAACHLK